MELLLSAHEHKRKKEEFELSPPMSEARNLKLVPTFHYYVFIFIS